MQSEKPPGGSVALCAPEPLAMDRSEILVLMDSKHPPVFSRRFKALPAKMSGSFADPKKASPAVDMSRFLAGWLKKPLMTGAIFPSSMALGRQMASYVPWPLGENDVVLELGPGTGVVTRCLVERGIPESQLVLLEYSPQFCKLLQSRLPDADIVQTDAYAPGPVLDKALKGRNIRAVVSSLPLMTRPDHQREAAISSYLQRMQPGAPFIQFTYARRAPVLPERINARMEKSNWIKLNLPPARILVYCRDLCPDPALSS